MNGDGNQFTTNSSNYPPSALFLVLPWAVMPWGLGHVAWLATIGACMIAATFFAARLCGYAPLVLAGLGAFLMGGTSILMSAQPAGVAIGLCVIAVCCLLEKRWPMVAIVCFAISLALKPQIGAFLWLYFLAEPSYRRRAFKILGTTAAICVPAVAWVSLMPASRHWLTHETHVVTLIAHKTNVTVNYEAIHFVHLQPLLLLFSDRTLLNNGLTWGLVLLMLSACLGIAYYGAELRNKDINAIAAIACMSLLPVYHRDHDVRLLIVVFPAIACLIRSRRLLGFTTLSVVTLLGIVTSAAYTSRMKQLQIATGASWGSARTALLTRTAPLLEVTLSVIFVLASLRPAGEVQRLHAVDQ